MYPAPNNNHHEPTEEGCDLCGFMKPDFREGEEIVDRNLRELRGMSESVGSSIYNPTFRQQDPRRYEHSLNVEDLTPSWIKEEIKRLFPETSNPGKFPCWISRIIGNSCWTESRD
jgi:hypothetical protein